MYILQKASLICSTVHQEVGVCPILRRGFSAVMSPWKGECISWGNVNLQEEVSILKYPAGSMGSIYLSKMEKALEKGYFPSKSQGWLLGSVQVQQSWRSRCKGIYASPCRGECLDWATGARPVFLEDLWDYRFQGDGQLTIARARGALEGSTDLRSQAERVTYPLPSYSLLSSEHSDLFYFISVGFLNISSHSPLTWQKSKNPFFKLCITIFSGFCTFQESPL